MPSISGARPDRSRSADVGASCATDQDRSAARDIFRRVGDKWSLVVIAELRDGPVRFTALMRRIGGISHRLLAATLKSLERDGIVARMTYREVPPRVEYELTGLGQSLLAPVVVLAGWAESHRPHIQEQRDRYDTR